MSDQVMNMEFQTVPSHKHALGTYDGRGQLSLLGSVLRDIGNSDDLQRAVPLPGTWLATLQT